MNDDKGVTEGTGEEDIVFNPPPAVDPTRVPLPPRGGGISFPRQPTVLKIPTPAAASEEAAQSSADALSEEVGLKIDPATRPRRDSKDFSKLLQDVKLQERREHTTGEKNEIPLTPPAAPVGAITASMPQFVRSRNPYMPAGIASSPIPMQKDVPAPPPLATTHDTAPAIKTPSTVVSLHTMKGDVQETVRRDRVSSVRAAALEAQKRARVAPPPASSLSAPTSKKSAFFAVASIVFIALGSIALYATYSVATQKNPPPALTTSLIFSEQQTVLPLDGVRADVLKQTLARFAASVGSGSGSVLRIIPTVTATSTGKTRLATLQEFLSAIGASPPDELVRALSTQFFFGIHSAADKPSPILIVPVVSYDHAFAGMLAWESTMDAQLSPPFPVVSPYLPSQSTTTLPALRTFQDVVMHNYDVRVLKDDDESVALYYSFPNQRLLIIAGSPNSFAEILSRLQASRNL